MRRPYRSALALVLCFAVIAVPATAATLMAAQGPTLDHAVKAGRFVLRHAAQIGDTTMARGTYHVTLTPKEDGVYIGFTRKGRLVDDLAIEQPATYTRKHPSIHVVKVWNQAFLKVTVHYGNTLYISYLPMK